MSVNGQANSVDPRREPLAPENVDRVIEELFYLYDDLHPDGDAELVEDAMESMQALRDEDVIG